MADVTIDACLPRAVTIHAPAHRLIYLAPQFVRFGYISVTLGAIDARARVRLVRKKNICSFFKPVDARPPRLFAALIYGRELLDFGAVRLFSDVAGHAGFRVRYGRVRRLVGMLMTISAIEFGAAFFCDVLPVIESYGLARRFRFARGLQQDNACDQYYYGHKSYVFRRFSHLFSDFAVWNSPSCHRANFKSIIQTAHRSQVLSLKTEKGRAVSSPLLSEPTALISESAHWPNLNTMPNCARKV